MRPPSPGLSHRQLQRGHLYTDKSRTRSSSQATLPLEFWRNAEFLKHRDGIQSPVQTIIWYDRLSQHPGLPEILLSPAPLADPIRFAVYWQRVWELSTGYQQHPALLRNFTLVDVGRRTLPSRLKRGSQKLL